MKAIDLAGAEMPYYSSWCKVSPGGEKWVKSKLSISIIIPQKLCLSVVPGCRVHNVLFSGLWDHSQFVPCSLVEPVCVPLLFKSPRRHRLYTANYKIQKMLRYAYYIVGFCRSELDLL